MGLTSSDQQQKIMIEGNIMRLDTLSTRGRWCGYQDGFSPMPSANSIITYDRYVIKDTNMDVSVTPLDITTGVFTVPMTGTYRINFGIITIGNRNIQNRV